MTLRVSYMPPNGAGACVRQIVDYIWGKELCDIRKRVTAIEVRDRSRWNRTVNHGCGTVGAVQQSWSVSRGKTQTFGSGGLKLR